MTKSTQPLFMMINDYLVEFNEDITEGILYKSSSIITTDDMVAHFMFIDELSTIYVQPVDDEKFDIPPDVLSKIKDTILQYNRPKIKIHLLDDVNDLITYSYEDYQTKLSPVVSAKLNYDPSRECKYFIHKNHKYFINEILTR